MSKRMLVSLALVLATLFPVVANAAPLGQEMTYTVKKGDTLWDLAEKHLGSGLAYWAIVFATNKKAQEGETFATIVDPGLIYPGWKLLIPSAEEAAELLKARIAGAVTVTEVIKYIPTMPAGEEREGSCWTNSLTVARADAWRCMVDNEIFDPCFALEDDANAVVCGADPRVDEPGFKLKLTEPLPEPDVSAEAMADNKAWLIELADGTFCNFASGATLGFGEKRVNYLCSDGSSILGDLQPGPIWTAERVLIEHGEDGFFVKESETVAIRTVWQ